MASIRIKETPPGFAPPHIRMQWVGVELPLASEEEIAQDPPSGFSIGSDNIGGYLVLRDKAIGALRNAGKEKAAGFWDQFPLGRYLRFGREFCEVVE